MKIEEISMIQGALSNLHNLKVINDSEFNLLNEYYSKDKRPFNVIKEEIIRLANDTTFKGNLINYLGEADIEVINVEPVLITSITDFKKNGKDYLKLNYSDNSIKVIYNDLGKSGNDTFNFIKQKYDGNASKVFEELIENAKEVKLYDNSTIANFYQSLTEDAKQSLYLMLSDERYKGKSMLFSPEEDIYIVRDVYDIILHTVGGTVREITDEPIVNDNEGIEKDKQKKLSASRFKWLDEDNGFMNALYVIFLTGLSCGIIIMIILNLMIK